MTTEEVLLKNNYIPYYKSEGNIGYMKDNAGENVMVEVRNTDTENVYLYLNNEFMKMTLKQFIEIYELNY